MNRWAARYAALLCVSVGWATIATGQEAAQLRSVDRSGVRAAEWPSYRRDSGLTGFSPLSGALAEAPSQRWSFDLGGTGIPTERVQLVDVNGDGRDELVRVLTDRIICQSVRGETLWESRRFASPQILQIRDFAGDGARGLLIATSTGVAHHRFMVSGATGQAVFLYTCKNVFGRYERWGKILAGVPGEQLCAWWSGDSETRFGGDAALGVGYLWSFEDGLAAPRLRFHAEEQGTIYAPLHLFADMDGDGDTDMVMISHEAMWVYDLESGEKLTHTAWGPQIRTYWAATAAMPLAEGELPSLLMINPMIPGVQVVTQDGQTAVSKWKRVVGKSENQYQPNVKIDRAAPDPFVDLDKDGEIEILAAVTNEHGDEKTHLVIFGANQGERVYDVADQTVLTVDELDGVDPPEILLREGDGALRICHWDGSALVDLWRSEQATPLVMPVPAEGQLARAVGARSSSRNMPLWRDRPDGQLFLLRFADGVWGCRLSSGSLERVERIARHAALGSLSVPPRDYKWDGAQLTVSEQGSERVTFELPRRPSYSAPPPVVGRLGDAMRVVVREFSGSLVSLAADGSDRRVLIEKSPRSLGVSIVDLDGDGRNEVLGLSKNGQGVTEIVAIGARGKRVLAVVPPEGATETALGPTGRLGAGRGRWFVARYRVAYQNTRVVAYDGASGEILWVRNYLGPQRSPSTSFVLHLPTAVHDLDRDGCDDLIASSENWYEVISVVDNRSLTPNATITAVVPGHWGAYATPIVVGRSGNRPPLVFHNNAYALALLTQLDATPVWHYGLTRDTTQASQAGLADLDGDGVIELVTTQRDGLLRAFEAAPSGARCPSCPPDGKLTPHNHGAQVRWTFPLPPPISDFATLDADADGRTELLCGAGDSRLHALRGTGGRCEVLWSVDLGAPVGAPVIADLDGDGRPEVLVASVDGRLHCLGPARR
ncbi:MAG: hypothetical protein CMJ59_25225 [Planctomycetaceae bacterium]|nr:hypothetical protein [Planctomycetaceae bacterium]